MRNVFLSWKFALSIFGRHLPKKMVISQMPLMHQIWTTPELNINNLRYIIHFFRSYLANSIPNNKLHPSSITIIEKAGTQKSNLPIQEFLKNIILMHSEKTIVKQDMYPFHYLSKCLNENQYLSSLPDKQKRFNIYEEHKEAERLVNSNKAPSGSTIIWLPNLYPAVNKKELQTSPFKSPTTKVVFDKESNRLLSLIQSLISGTKPNLSHSESLNNRFNLSKSIIIRMNFLQKISEVDNSLKHAQPELEFLPDQTDVSHTINHNRMLASGYYSSFNFVKGSKETTPKKIHSATTSISSNDIHQNSLVHVDSVISKIPNRFNFKLSDSAGNQPLYQLKIQTAQKNKVVVTGQPFDLFFSIPDMFKATRHRRKIYNSNQTEMAFSRHVTLNNKLVFIKKGSSLISRSISTLNLNKSKKQEIDFISSDKAQDGILSDGKVFTQTASRFPMISNSGYSKKANKPFEVMTQNYYIADKETSFVLPKSDKPVRKQTLTSEPVSSQNIPVRAQEIDLVYDNQSDAINGISTQISGIANNRFINEDVDQLPNKNNRKEVNFVSEQPLGNREIRKLAEKIYDLFEQRIEREKEWKG